MLYTSFYGSISNNFNKVVQSVEYSSSCNLLPKSMSIESFYCVYYTSNNNGCIYYYPRQIYHFAFEIVNYV